MKFGTSGLLFRILFFSAILAASAATAHAADEGQVTALETPAFQNFLSGLFGARDSVPDKDGAVKAPTESEQTASPVDPDDNHTAAEALKSESKSRHGRGRAIDPTIKALVSQHASANELPLSLAHAIVMIESRYNPRVHNHGALGLMQIKAQTARTVGFTGPDATLLDAETNLKFGMLYLAQVYRAAGGDVCGTIMRYQSGHLAARLTSANRVYCARAQRMMAGT